MFNFQGTGKTLFSTPQALFALLAGLVPILAILEIIYVWMDGCRGIEKTVFTTAKRETSFRISILSQMPSAKLPKRGRPTIGAFAWLVFPEKGSLIVTDTVFTCGSSLPSLFSLSRLSCLAEVWYPFLNPVSLNIQQGLPTPLMKDGDTKPLPSGSHQLLWCQKWKLRRALRYPLHSLSTSVA